MYSIIFAFLIVAGAVAVADANQETECCSGNNCAGYRGKNSTTKTGKICLRWTQEEKELFPNAGLDKNYCRNPDDDEKGAWCFTTGNLVGYCKIPCPDGYEYQFTIKPKRTWYDAEAFCVKWGGHLVMEKTEKIRVESFDKVGRQKFWIGVRRKPENKNIFIYADQSPVENVYWEKHPHQPDNYGGDEDCVQQLASTLWNDIRCGVKLPYLCQRRKFS